MRDSLILILVALEFHSLLTLLCIAFNCDDLALSCSVSLTARMDETRVDITNQEDGAGDDIALLQAPYTRIRTFQSLSAFSDYSARVDDLPSSPTRSPLHLTSLSSEPLRSPHTVGSPNTADTGLVFLRCLLPRCVTRGGMSRELRQELFAEMRSELLRSQQEIAMGVRGFKVSHSSIHW